MAPGTEARIQQATVTRFDWGECGESHDEWYLHRKQACFYYAPLSICLSSEWHETKHGSFREHAQMIKETEETFPVQGSTFLKDAWAATISTCTETYILHYKKEKAPKSRIGLLTKLLLHSHREMFSDTLPFTIIPMWARWTENQIRENKSFIFLKEEQRVMDYRPVRPPKCNVTIQKVVISNSDRCKWKTDSIWCYVIEGLLHYRCVHDFLLRIPASSVFFSRNMNHPGHRNTFILWLTVILPSFIMKRQVNQHSLDSTW